MNTAQQEYQRLDTHTRLWYDPYIRRIRNATKREYAMRFAAWRSLGGPFDFDGGPEDSAHGLRLSSMARQAVRMNIDEIYRGHTK